MLKTFFHLLLLFSIFFPVGISHSQDNQSDQFTEKLIHIKFHSTDEQDLVVTSYEKKSDRIIFHATHKSRYNVVSNYRFDLIQNNIGAYTSFEIQRDGVYTCTGDANVNQIDWDERSSSDLQELGAGFGGYCSVYDSNGNVYPGEYYLYGSFSFRDENDCDQYKESLENLKDEVEALKSANLTLLENNNWLSQNYESTLSRAINAENRVTYLNDRNNILTSQLNTLQNAYNALKKKYDKLKKR